MIFINTHVLLLDSMYQYNTNWAIPKLVTKYINNLIFLSKYKYKLGRIMVFKQSLAVHIAVILMYCRPDNPVTIPYTIF